MPVGRPSLRKTTTGLCAHSPTRSSCEKPIPLPAAHSDQDVFLFCRSMSNTNPREEGTAVRRGEPSRGLPPRSAAATNSVRTQESDGLWRTVAGGDHAGEVGIPATRRRDAHGEACHAGHEHVSVRVGHGVSSLRGVFAFAPSTFSEAGTDADRHPESIAAATAVYLLAVSGLAAPGHRTAIVGSAAADEGTGVGSGPCPTGGSDTGHRHDRAHAVRASDGRAQELQPKEQG